MTYDVLNRVRSKVYSGLTPEGTAVANATPPVNYFYDDCSGLPSGAPCWPGAPSKGRLIGVTYGTGSEGTYYKYDAAGRIVTNHQRMGTSNYATAYFYNRTDAVTREERGIPARRRILMGYDAAGRLATMDTGSYPFLTYVPLVGNVSYTPFGGLQSETYGNGLIHSIGYNNRLQPTEIRLGRPDNLESVFTIYSIYGTANNVNSQDAEITAAHNNGNIARIRYSVSGTIQYTQTFQYDQLNRLRYAVEHNNGAYNEGARAWYQTFDYDQYGNRGINVANTSDNVDAANSALQLADFSGANNRITRAGFIYDAAGNLIAEPGKGYTYDAENRIVTATLAGGTTSQYVYDGNGRRVKKIVGGVATRFEYGVGGDLITERNDSNGNVIKDYFYKGGQLLATKAVGSSEYQFATSDHLGSPRVWTDDSGALIAGGRHDYAPFGEELSAGVGIRSASLGYGEDSTRQKFGSKERDNETGLDYFGARYLASVQGRFTSPDIPFADQYERDPQSWNLYTYVRNNPIRYIDPLGLARTDANGNWIGDFDGEYDKQTKLYWNKKNGYWESKAEFNFSRGPEQLADRIGVAFRRITYQSKFGNSDRTGARGVAALAGAVYVNPLPNPHKFIVGSGLLFAAGLAYLTNYNNAPPPLLINPNIEARNRNLELVDYMADKYGIPRDLLSDEIHWVKEHEGRGGADNLGKKRIEEIAKQLSDELKKLGEGEGEGKPDN